MAVAILVRVGADALSRVGKRVGGATTQGIGASLAAGTAIAVIGDKIRAEPTATSGEARRAVAAATTAIIGIRGYVGAYAIAAGLARPARQATLPTIVRVAGQVFADTITIAVGKCGAAITVARA